MYSFKFMSSACFRRPGKLWLYSGVTTMNPSQRSIVVENFGSFICSPASSSFNWKLAHIDQFRLHIRTFLRLLKNETPDVLALSSLTRSAKNHWNEKRTRVHISNFPFCANRSFCSFRNPRSEIESADGRTRTGTGLLRPNGF